MKKILISSVCIIFLVMALVSAGVGIKWDSEARIINEGDKTCMSYSVYNPWPEESFVKIVLSDELAGVFESQDSEVKRIPAQTSSGEAIPVKFCFKAPKVYERDCWIGDSFICKQECNEDQVSYDGEVIVKSVPNPTGISGSGGSATAMSVSAPLKIKIRCNSHSRDFTIVYIGIALISVVVIVFSYFRIKKSK